MTREPCWACGSRCSGPWKWPEATCRKSAVQFEGSIFQIFQFFNLNRRTIVPLEFVGGPWNQVMLKHQSFLKNLNQQHNTSERCQPTVHPLTTTTTTRTTTTTTTTTTSTTTTTTTTTTTVFTNQPTNQPYLFLIVTQQVNQGALPLWVLPEHVEAPALPDASGVGEEAVVGCGRGRGTGEVARVADVILEPGCCYYYYYYY